METRNIPEAFHPGEYIREESDERGWTPGDLATILGVDRTIVSDLFAGRRSVSAEMAKALGDAFETGAQYWLNLQSAYRLATATQSDDAVTRRARLFAKAPVTEMQRRGWIEKTTNVDVLEAQVCQFLEIKTIDDSVSFDHAARKSTDYSSTNSAQRAWLFRARKVARALSVENQYNGRNFNSLMKDLALLRAEPDEIRHVPSLLSQYGIRFLVIEHLPKTKIDGACFWLDKSKDKPVIVLSLRYDRIDWFWHSMIHELSHVKNREGMDEPMLDSSMFGEDALPEENKPDMEKRADKFAVEFLVDQTKLQSFVDRHSPMFSKKDIKGFANLWHVHPGIVVGQLHHRQVILWSHLRQMLVKIRDIITETAPTDGWGRMISI